MKPRSRTRRCSHSPGRSHLSWVGIGSRITSRWSTRAWKGRKTSSTIRKARGPDGSKQTVSAASMKTSTERILTTHVGSLPRPQEVADLLFAQDRGERYDPAHFDEVMRRGVSEAVRLQQAAGID